MKAIRRKLFKTLALQFAVGCGGMLILSIVLGLAARLAVFTYNLFP